MVESAILYPLIFASIMAMIYLLVNLYSAASLQAYLHNELRDKAYQEVMESEIIDRVGIDKYRAKAERKDININRNVSYLSAKKSVSYRGNGIIKKSASREEYGRSYIIDEAKYYRIMK